MSELYDKYRATLVRLADVSFASALLQWDQETYMPPKGASFRAGQLSTLAGIAHEMAVDPALGELLAALEKDNSLGEKEKKNIAWSMREYKRSKKFDKSFVEEMSRTVSGAFQAWQVARKNNDFKTFAPHLEKLVELKYQEAEILGYEDHPYDALIDQYEPGTKTAEVKAVFDGMMPALKELIAAIAREEKPVNEFMRHTYNESKQWDFTLDLLRQMGYDMEAGRQDKSSHPFSISFNPHDVRVTTRVNEHDLSEILWSTIHEGGHALYEQGLPPEEYGLPSGEFVSLAVHESQSRLWENNVGRSLPYWKHNFPKLKEIFPEQLKGVSVEQFYQAMNRVEPSLIRTNADELTYHMHVYIRFTIERELMERKISVAELPERWNGLYREYLDIEVPSDAQGVLQDVHWSHGSFGYFPTYSLGSFYAAQYFAQAEKDLHGLQEQIGEGNLLPLLGWLRKNIHRHGKQYTAGELCERVTGSKLDPQHFLKYARGKYEKIYQLSTKSA